MLSKVLPFNKTLLKKDWLMTGWAFYIYLFVIIMSVPYNLARNLDKLNSENYAEGSSVLYTIKRVLSLENEIVTTLALIVPVFIAIILIGEEKRKKTIEIMVSGPFSRIEIFFNKVMLGIFILVVPFVAAGSTLLVMRFTSEYVGDLLTVSQIVIWMLSYSAFSIAMFSFSCIVGMIFGSSIGQFFCTYIFGVFPMVFFEMIYFSSEKFYNFARGSNMFYDNTLRSFSVYFEMISPIRFFFRIFEYSDSMQMIFSFRLLIISVAMLLLALVLFEVSKMEKNAEVLTFESLEKFFRFGVFISSILAGGIIFSGMMALGMPGLIIGYAVGGFAGYKIPIYLIQKSRVS